MRLGHDETQVAESVVALRVSLRPGEGFAGSKPTTASVEAYESSPQGRKY
jgi:hypothetical protein